MSALSIRRFSSPDSSDESGGSGGVSAARRPVIWPGEHRNHRSMPPGSQSVTIQQVADLAQVATKTVSRVINDEPGVHADTRSRILKAIEQLDYRPNLNARGLAGDRSFLIGLFCDKPGDYLSTFQAGAVERCRESGFHLMVEPWDSAESRRRPPGEITAADPAPRGRHSAAAAQRSPGHPEPAGRVADSHRAHRAEERAWQRIALGRHRRLRRGAPHDQPSARSRPPPHRLHHRPRRPRRQRAASSRIS